MGELTLTAFLTLDGVMQSPGGPTEDPSGGFAQGGWLVPHFDAGVGAAMTEIFTKVDAFLLGRTTYDLMAAYWPHVPQPEENPLNARPKFVASRTRSTFAWQGSELVRDVVKAVPALKQRFAGELQVHGSAGLAQTLIAHDLIDEYRLFTFPVIVGPGKRLFGSGAVPAAVTLASSHTTASGVVISVYRRAGSIKIGALEMPPTTEG